MAALETDLSDLAHDLAWAVVASSAAPLLLMRADHTVLAASRSFPTTFQIEPEEVLDRKIETLGQGEWDIVLAA